MPIDPSIFKAYDIRGLYGDQLGPDDAERIGRAFVRVAFFGVLGNLPMCHQHLNPAHALQAGLWAGAYEDQVLPGGGSA